VLVSPSIFRRDELERSSAPVPQSAGLRWQAVVAALLVVTLSVVLPRVAGLSALPTTDEGYYAYFSMRIAAALSQGSGLPADGYLMLYPLLTAWVFDLPANPFVVLRLIDLVVATVAGALFYTMLRRESRSVWFAALLSVIFLLTMNWAAFVQNGYRNSIFLAYVPLMLSVILMQGQDRPGERRLFLVGCLVALGILIREPFAGFSILAVGAAWVRFGRRSAAAVAAGGIATAVVVLIPVLLLRGSLPGFIAAYLDAGTMFSAVQDQRFTLFVNAVSTWAKASMVPLGLASVALVALMLAGARGGERGARGRAAFWLAVAVVPLIEPIMKIGFPYHFASALPGLAGLCALAWRLVSSRSLSIVLMALAGGAAYLFFQPQVSWQMKTVRQAAADAVHTGQGGWSQEAHQASNYLIAADLIEGASAPGSTLSVSGFMFTLFPLTGRVPASAELSDLTLALIDMGMDGDRLSRALAACPPDVIMTTTRTEWPGAALIEKVVSGSGLYRLVGTVPVNEAVSYGTFGGNVYARTSPEKPRCGP